MRRSVRALGAAPWPRQSPATVNNPDVVVLGAGSAGCVLANRLVTEGKRSVMLVEAGISDRGAWDWWKIAMPSALTYNLGDQRYNWDHWTVPQKRLAGRRLHQPRGKVLGGSSCLNAMAYVRGNALDYERWAEEGAGEAWRYANVLPYFRKAQRHQLGASTYRGGDGPLEVTRRMTPVTRPINEAFVQAGQEAGYPYTEDMNGFQQEGFGPMDMTVTTDGVRASVAHCYLRPIMDNPLLQVRTGLRAAKLLWDGTRCVGVELIPATKGGGQPQTVHCGEVVLALGSVGSPLLLQRSGVGDPALLQKFGIPQTIANPQVGANLQDHLEFYMQYKCKKACTLYPYAATFPLPGALKRYAFRNPLRAASAGLSWATKGSGVGASNHFEVGGFVRSRAGIRHPDIQYHFIAGCVDGQLDFIPAHGYQVHAGTMRPSSRGYIRITSTDPYAEPEMDPNYLATEMDREDMRATLRITDEIMRQEAFAPFRGETIKPVGIDLKDDLACDKWIAQNSHSAYHPSCTVAMGTVVDPEGKLLGAENVRVCDAGIMPSMSSGNLNAPTIMIAEKIADAMRGVQLPPDPDAVWHEHPSWESKQR
eukprot:TRINITY_DN6878_c0_g2_i1.p1 TRINITY_DN6878_c0_g2~~TRINITY_DN6878_c0_g2_i1.p1  ORF type:complete len:592 (+),score=193.19 TRINITY_DN6878_c0_g2_i1:86-1861(+)